MENVKNNPKAILVLDEIKARSVKWEKEYDQNEEIQILSFIELGNLPFRFEKKPKLNQIYIEHPFLDGYYIQPELDPHELQRLKLNNISQICALLGAKSFMSTILNKKELEKDNKIGFDVNLPAGGIEGEFSKHSGKKLTQYYEVHHFYEGSEPNVDKANEFLISSGLIKDQSISQLIQRRNPNNGNLSKSEKLKVNMAKEIEECFEFGASLKAMAGKFNLGVKYASKELSREIIELEIQISF